MSKFYLVFLSRLGLVAAITMSVFAPTSYVLLNELSTSAEPYPTVRLLLMAAAVTVIGFALTWFVPTLEQLVTQRVFSGSYDYQAAVIRIATYVTTRVPLQKVLTFSARSLSQIAKAPVTLEQVAVIQGVSKSTETELRIPLGTTTCLRFGKKSNADPWTAWDKKLLHWFAEQAGPIVDLAQEQRREQLRLKQVEQRLAESTQALRALNDRLSQRDRAHALEFDQLAHDLKNPVAVMSFALEERAKANEDYKTARAEIAWMAKFIDHILDLSRAEAGKVTAQKDLVDLIDLIDDAAESMLSFASTQQRRILWRGPRETQADFFTRGDPGLLFKLLQLLLLRTIRFTQDTLVVELTSSLDSKTIYIDFVTSPLPERQTKHLKKLLDDIKDARPNHEDRQSGVTGLELHIANWIAHEHGGQLLLPEADEQRTVVRVTLPAARL